MRGTLQIKRRVSPATIVAVAVAVAAVAATIFPPWMIPGAGVIVLRVVRCVARAKERRGFDPAHDDATVAGSQLAPHTTTTTRSPAAG